MPMDRSLALYSLGTFAAYIVCFKVVEYLIAFVLDDAIVTALNQNAVLDNIVGIALSTLAFGVAFQIVAIGRVKQDPKTVALYMSAPFALVGLIAIGRGLGGAELLFRAIFIAIVFYLTIELLKRHSKKSQSDEEDGHGPLVTGPSKRRTF